MTTIPAKGKWIQSNRSDIFGNLWSTFGIDLQSNLGLMRVTPRLKVNVSTSDLANLGCPVAIVPFGAVIYALAGSRIFVNNGAPSYPNVAFAEDTSTNAGTDYSSDYSDMCQFNDLLFATAPSALRKLTGVGGTWADVDSFSTTDEVHKLCYFKKTNRLYYSQNESFINSIDTAYSPADSGDYTLDWTGLVAFTDMKASSNYIWIAGKVDNLSRTDSGVIWRWDGVTSQITQEYKIAGTNGIHALAIDPRTDSPVAMGDNGILYGFNGTGFTELGRLPFTNYPPFAGTSPISSGNKADRWIHPNGLAVTDNGTVLANINGKNNNYAGTQNENIPSGIWEWSKENGFVHKYPFSYDPITSSITDFGQERISRAGAISLINPPSTADGRDGTFLAGATLFSNATSTTSVIAFDNSIDTIRKAGSFITTWLTSRDIQDNWSSIHAIYKQLLNSTDKIILKYRLTEDTPTEATITWVDTTSFTTTVDISAYANDATGFDGTYGGEVRVLNGTGGGNSRHITNVSESGGTYTVTIDSAVVGVTTGTAKASFQKWIKLTPEITDQVNGYTELPIGKNSTKIQFRGYMEFTGKNELYKLEPDNTKFL